MPARARLPDNLMPRAMLTRREETLGLHESGELLKIHRFIGRRIADLGVECDHEGGLWMHDSKASDNLLWLLLRADVEAQGFCISRVTLRKTVEHSLKLIRDASKKVARPGTRVVTIFQE